MEANQSAGCFKYILGHGGKNTRMIETLILPFKIGYLQEFDGDLNTFLTSESKFIEIDCSIDILVFFPPCSELIRTRS